MNALRMRLSALALALAAGAPSFGCAGSLVPPPIMSEAALGRVIIYRNGVAYFERYLPPTESELTLRVPVERVDDFLKSLNVIDRKTGEAMPVSYPTMDRHGGDVQMTIKLPEKHNGLKISYVTESPAWKPSYRVVLGDGGKAILQAWAVVDNVSGEDWKHVKVGVGSTSALSFRYDLHSVRIVEREELSSGSLLAVAPPTGGGAYGQKNKQLRVMANLDQIAVDELGSYSYDDKDEDGKGDERSRRLTVQKSEIHGRVSKPSAGWGRGSAGGATATTVPSASPSAAPPPPPSRHSASNVTRDPGPSHHGKSGGDTGLVSDLSRQLRGSNERVRIEGYARSGDKDARFSSLERANRVREELIRNGVLAGQIEAVGTGELNESQAVRVLAVDGEGENAQTEKPAKPADAAVEAEPAGQAHFVSSEAMSIAADHSAMLSILNQETVAERIYFYDPISERGSKSFAFNAIKLVNPSKYTLDSGPFTVYVKGQFLGEGLAEPILPQSAAFIPYALDRTVIVEPEITGREEIDKLITIQRGIVTTETRQIKKTKLDITNRGKQDATVYVRHQVAPEHTLSTTSVKIEKLGGAHLFPVKVTAGQTLELVIEEWTPIKKTVDIRTDAGVEAIGLYVRKARIDKELGLSLGRIVEHHKAGAGMEQRIQLLGDQMGVYRTRIDEINVQLVTLKSVQQAAKLRKHLADRMEEISNKLQGATMEVADLKAKLMTLRIELQDKLAELTLKKDDSAAKDGAPKDGAAKVGTVGKEVTR